MIRPRPAALFDPAGNARRTQMAEAAGVGGDLARRPMRQFQKPSAGFALRPRIRHRAAKWREGAPLPDRADLHQSESSPYLPAARPIGMRGRIERRRTA